MTLSHEEQLSIISKAWGKQDGYCFFPWIDGKATTREERIRGYNEGRAYKWPEEKKAILAHLKAKEHDDLYWCPSLFEKKIRQQQWAMDEHALWADLDAVDPREIDEEYRPTIAWESSPGRFQALWIISSGDVQGASWPGGENQRLTYYLGADTGGWDTTQLLRIPGWDNHKPDYKKKNNGKPVKGKLLWKTGQRYLPDAFTDLPDVQATNIVEDVLEDEIRAVNRQEVWGRVRLKVNHTARELFSAREVAGDRSEKLWYLIRCLADVGCTATEIVALVKDTVWNKFSGRQDELKRLVSEASKAIGSRSEEKTKELEEERAPKPKPQRLFALIRDAKAPEWLVENVWAEGACGFIAGQPKSFKTWTGMDLAMSIASGIPFLDHFTIVNPGPVLYIQEEDPIPTVKQRTDKIWPGKLSDKMVSTPEGIVWAPPSESKSDGPDVAAYIGEGFVISDGGWQAWLDETLAEGFEGDRYRMVVIDPLMMVAGDVEENRAQEMTEKVFKPLKQMSRKHEVAVALVHHMRKGDPAKPQRGGQLMLGSVANHAWAEDSLYLRLGRGGEVIVERESKHTTSGSFRISGLRNKNWTPTVIDDRSDGDEEEEAQGASGSTGTIRQGGRKGAGKPKKSKALAALEELGPGRHSTARVAEKAGVGRSGAHKQLVRLEEQGKIKRQGHGTWVLA